MIKYGYAALRQFPKSEKHVLSAEIRQSMFSLLRLIIVCNHRLELLDVPQQVGYPQSYTMPTKPDALYLALGQPVPEV